MRAIAYMLSRAVTLDDLEWHIQGLPKVFKYPLLSQERVKLRTSHFAVHSWGPSEQKPIKNLGEKGAWAYLGTAQKFKNTLYYLRNG